MTHLQQPQLSVWWAVWAELMQPARHVPGHGQTTGSAELGIIGEGERDNLGTRFEVVSAHLYSGLVWVKHPMAVVNACTAIRINSVSLV